MTLLAARLAHAQRRLAGQESLSSSDGRMSYQPKTFHREIFSDPDTVARKALEYCRKDLGLPADMTTCFCDTPGSWGVVYEDSPRVLHLNQRLRDEPHLRQQLIETVGHEARHARFILDGRYEYDLHAERVATDYGHRIAALWRTL